MKKKLAVIMAVVMLMGTNVHAAWEFDVKVIREDAGGARIVNGTIETYKTSYAGYDYNEYYHIYFDFNGNTVNKPSESLGTVSEQLDYFTRNNQSIVVTDSNGTRLTDLNGNTLASGFELSNYWEKNDVARKVKKNERYGIMGYDGRMIIPMQNDGAVIYNYNIYVAINGNVVSAYNYAGEKLFTLDEGVAILRTGGADWIIVELKESGKYALINYKGEYLTDFEYDYISIYENNASWQSGAFAILKNSSGEKYINRNFDEIDIFAEKGVYCQNYIEFNDTVAINNSTENKLPMTALFDKRRGEYMIPFRDGITYTNGDMLVYSDFENSYMSDLYGNNTVKLDYKITSIDEFKDGIAVVDYNRWICDTQGRNIFSGKYYYVDRIDNNEFVVWNGGPVMILTAKGIIGEALYTDVKIDINGVQIPCRSVYGYAGVIAEDLRSFGFDVIWDEERRLLSITRNPEYYSITPTEFESDGTPGTHYADIYGSDINVEYNGKRISSYCIDGRTIIKAEDLAAEGITFDYDNAVRTLFMSVDGLERK